MRGRGYFGAGVVKACPAGPPQHAQQDRKKQLSKAPLPPPPPPPQRAQQDRMKQLSKAIQEENQRKALVGAMVAGVGAGGAAGGLAGLSAGGG